MSDVLRLTPAFITRTLGLEPMPDAVRDQPINRATSDSREVRGGEMFVALRGEHADGHDYVRDALDRGATIALVNHVPAGLDTAARERLVVVPSTLKALQVLARCWRAQFSIPIIGITGSVGKTTTKEIVADVLSARFRVLRSIKSFNNEIGLPLTLLGITSRDEVAVIEMGMSGIGEIAQLCAIARPTHGIVTVIGESHLEYLGTRENIALAKQELVEALPPEGLAILNADDPLVAPMAAHTPARVRTFGLTPTAHLHYSDLVSRGFDGISMTVHWRDRTYPFVSSLPGIHNATSIGAAIIAGLDLGMQLGEIAEAVSRIRLDIRQRIVKGRDGIQVIDDTYNASPTSVLAALDLLATSTSRRVAVLGDMLELGADEEPGHRRVGLRAAQAANVLVAVGPRARWIAEAAAAAGMAQIVRFPDTAAAVTGIGEIVQPGDAVLVKGSRAMTMEKVVEALR